MRKIKVIGFDADDTLWENEIYYHEAEILLCDLLKGYSTADDISAELLQIETGNMNIYGYGTKAFTLSMLETALSISKNTVSPETIAEILKVGKGLLSKPVVLLENVESTLMLLKENYRLIVATKGDLLDQQRKIDNSGLKGYFDHIEIMNDKNEAEYKKLLDKLNVNPDEFLMVGNSLKSDVLPVKLIGGKAIHIPYHITWQHEQLCNTLESETVAITNIADLVNYLN